MPRSRTTEVAQLQPSQAKDMALHPWSPTCTTFWLSRMPGVRLTPKVRYQWLTRPHANLLAQSLPLSSHSQHGTSYGGDQVVAILSLIHI